jgi:hypothetical protein
MDSYGGRTGHADELLSLPRRCRLMLQAAALAILLLELSLGISAAQVASTSKAREHVYLLRGAFNPTFRTLTVHHLRLATGWMSYLLGPYTAAGIESN